MRIAIPSDGNKENGNIYPFFGQPENYFIYDVNDGQLSLQEIRKNPISERLKGLGHGEKPPVIQKMIEDCLGDCDVFVAIGINRGIVENLTSKGKKVVFAEKKNIRETAEEIVDKNLY